MLKKIQGQQLKLSAPPSLSPPLFKSGCVTMHAPSDYVDKSIHKVKSKVADRMLCCIL